MFRPAFDGQVCSLGYQVIDWIVEYGCHGPGDVQGDPVTFDDEVFDFIVAAYELDPKTGRRARSKVVYSAPKGRAKALALDTPVPTPLGWTTMGEVRVGDEVFDAEGRPTLVTATSDVFVGHECFEVGFSDGERIIADAGHRWTVQELRKEYQEVTVDTAYLAKFRTTRADGACNFRMQLPGALRLPEVDLPIDPYVLGVWLGDGGSRDARVTLADPEVVAELRNAGHVVTARASYGPYGYYVSGLHVKLREAGLIKNKHVPSVYLRASADQRLALLQGLMDTDGTIGKDGRASFTSTRECLADAVVELVASLGMKCARVEFRTRMNGKDCGPGWKVDFWPTADVPVFRLPRKLARQQVGTHRRALRKTRRVTSVTPVTSVPTRCITVAAGSHQFLVGRRMVQTHNSETAGLIGVAEALGPVRFDGWDADGQPVGRPVRSPFIRALATEERQSGNTFQNIAFVMGEWGQDNHPDVYGGVKGIGDYRSAQNIYLPGGGECRSSSSGAASKDGGKETFLVPDEVHLYVLPELRGMYATAMRNLGKRRAADPWALLTTTACRLGEQSVWEVIEKQWKRGELGPDWLVHHREAKGRIDINDKARTLRQLLDVYGPAMDPETGWMDAERVYLDMLDPTICPDEQTAARYYLNRSMAGSDAWVAADVVERQTVPREVPVDEPIAVGFDGSLNDDSTVIRGCCMSDGYRFTLGLWERPAGAAGQGWEVPRAEVMARLREVLSTRTVSRLYADPHEWRTDIDALAEEFGDVVIPWATSRDTQMGYALDRLHSDLVKGVTFHEADKAIEAHYGNAYVRQRGKLRLVRKEYPNSPRKIDGVVADALAYEARADALAAGWSASTEPTIVFPWR